MKRRRSSALWAALPIAAALAVISRPLYPDTPVRAQAPARPASRPEDLVGEWRVDLRPGPNASAYFQTLVISKVDGTNVTARFYDSDVKHGRLNRDWGDVRFAFVTYDASGPYHTSGRLVRGRLEGTTHAIGRDFLSVWTAERVPNPSPAQR
jgi:hypothetical protein